MTTEKIDSKELWSLDLTLTDFILPRLVAFRNGEGNSHLDGPSGSPLLEGYAFENQTDEEDSKMYQEWLGILDKMIRAFELHKKHYSECDNVIDKEIKEGLSLFAKYYQYLWD
jgi:hypothetical protein